MPIARRRSACRSPDCRWRAGRVILARHEQGNHRCPMKAPAPQGRRHEAPVGTGESGHAATEADGLANVLAGTLPAGSKIVVRWRDPDGGRRRVRRRRARQRCCTRMRRAAWMGTAAGSRRRGIDAAWEDGDTRIAIAAKLSEPLRTASRCGVAGAGAAHDCRVPGVGARAGADRVAAEVAAPAAGALRDRRPGRLGAGDGRDARAASTTVVGGLMYRAQFLHRHLRRSARIGALPLLRRCAGSVRRRTGHRDPASRNCPTA